MVNITVEKTERLFIAVYVYVENSHCIIMKLVWIATSSMSCDYAWTIFYFFDHWNGGQKVGWWFVIITVQIHSANTQSLYRFLISIEL